MSTAPAPDPASGAPVSPHGGLAPVAALLEDYSLEMTGKDVPALQEAAAAIPDGTRVNVTFLGNEDLPMRLRAAEVVRASGFVPVPHISARRLPSQGALEDFLSALHGTGTSDDVFVVGGDPAVPEGPYEDSLSVIRSGVLERFGVRSVSVSGYPEGHPDIPAEALWSAVEGKAAALADQGLDGTVITQFGFDVDPVITWLEALRLRGVDLPVRIGVPGPAGVKRLLTYARRFGVGTSASIVKKYGFSLTNLLGTAGPDRFITELAGRYQPDLHGVVKLHFYAFGGLRTTAEWVDDFRGRC